MTIGVYVGTVFNKNQYLIIKFNFILFLNQFFYLKTFILCSKMFFRNISFDFEFNKKLISQSNFFLRF